MEEAAAPPTEEPALEKQEEEEEFAPPSSEVSAQSSEEPSSPVEGSTPPPATPPPLEVAEPHAPALEVEAAAVPTPDGTPASPAEAPVPGPPDHSAEPADAKWERSPVKRETDEPPANGNGRAGEPGYDRQPPGGSDGGSDEGSDETLDEDQWLQIAVDAEMAGGVTKATVAYERVLRLNPSNVQALTQLASISRMQERHIDTVGYLSRILSIEGPSGGVHSAIGHCYLTLSQNAEETTEILSHLRQCHSAYLKAMAHPGAKTDPTLWYGMGLLYERYGTLMKAGANQRECYAAAEEALRSVLQMAPQFEKQSEIVYRLGKIYKAQEKLPHALECFQSITSSPPPPLTLADVWFLIGSVQEEMELPGPEYAARAYEHVIKILEPSEKPKLARAYRQLGWVCHKRGVEGLQPPLTCLLKAVEIGPSDATAWHLLAKCLADHDDVDGAYEALTKSVSIDPAMAEAWSTAATLYSARGQTDEAAVALEHAVHLDPSSSAWLDLGVAKHSLALAGGGSAGGGSAARLLDEAQSAYARALSTVPSQHDLIMSRLQDMRGMRDRADRGGGGAPPPIPQQPESRFPTPYPPPAPSPAAQPHLIPGSVGAGGMVSVSLGPQPQPSVWTAQPSVWAAQPPPQQSRWTQPQPQVQMTSPMTTQPTMAPPQPPHPPSHMELVIAPAPVHQSQHQQLPPHMPQPPQQHYQQQPPPQQQQPPQPQPLPPQQQPQQPQQPQVVYHQQGGGPPIFQQHPIPAPMQSYPQVQPQVAAMQPVPVQLQQHAQHHTQPVLQLQQPMAMAAHYQAQH